MFDKRKWQKAQQTRAKHNKQQKHQKHFAIKRQIYAKKNQAIKNSKKNQLTNPWLPGMIYKKENNLRIKIIEKNSY